MPVWVQAGPKLAHCLQSSSCNRSTAAQQAALTCHRAALKLKKARKTYSRITAASCSPTCALTVARPASKLQPQSAAELAAAAVLVSTCQLPILPSTLSADHKSFSRPVTCCMQDSSCRSASEAAAAGMRCSRQQRLASCCSTLATPACRLHHTTLKTRRRTFNKGGSTSRKALCY